MADVYVANADVSAYAQKDSSSNVVKTYKKGDEIKIFIKEVGKNNIQYGNALTVGNMWVNMAFLTKVSSDPGNSNNTTINNNEDIGPSAENEDRANDDTIYGNTDSSYNKLLLRYIHAFGSPPRFTEEVDP